MARLIVVSLSGTLTGQKSAARMTKKLMPRSLSLTLLVLALVMLPTITKGQVVTNSITVIVQPITVVQVSVGILSFSFSGSNAIAGQDQMILADQTSTLSWGTNSSSKKITVSTDLSSPKYTLQIEAVSPTAGVAASPATLSTVAADLITGIGRSMGSCSLRYTVIALASQGTGTDSHTITFTVTS